MHQLTSTLLKGVKALKVHPELLIVEGVPRPVFEIITASLVNYESGLNLPQDLQTIEAGLAKLPESSSKLEAFSHVYRFSQNQFQLIQKEIRLPKGVEMTPQQAKRALDLLTKSTAFVAITTALPEEHLGNKKLIDNVAYEIFSSDVLTEKVFPPQIPQLPQENPEAQAAFNSIVKNAAKSSNISMPENTVGELASRATGCVTTRWSMRSPDYVRQAPGISDKASMGFYGFVSLVIALANQPPEELPEEVNQQFQQPEAEEGSGTGAFVGPLAGLGLGAILARRKTGEEEEEEEEKEKQETNKVDREKKPPEQEPELKNVSPEQKQPLVLPAIPEAPQSITVPTPSILRPIISSVTNNIGRFFAKSLGGVFKKALGWGVAALTGGTSKLATAALKIGGKLASLFGGFLGGFGQVDTGDLLKKSSIAIAFIIIVPLLLILVLSYYIVAVVIPTALVTSTTLSSSRTASSVSPSPGCQTGVGGGETVAGEPCPINITPVVSPYPTPGTTIGVVPRGFPLSSSCVTQPPWGSFTHQKLNAVDLGEIALFNSWEIRATHPGRVIWADWFGGYGMAVLLEDIDNRFVTYYGHIVEGSIPPNIRIGNQIEEGTLLGKVDNNGFSTGDHLHYEIRGPRGSTSEDLWGSKTGELGEIGTIYNFLPDCQTWSCQQYCYK